MLLPYISYNERVVLEFIMTFGALFALAFVFIPLLINYTLYKKMRPIFTGLIVLSLSITLTASILLYV